MERTNYAAAAAAILKQAGQTAYQMAKSTGLTQQAILDVMKAKRVNPRADTLDRLLRAAGLDWSFLNQFRVNETDVASVPHSTRKRTAAPKGKR